MSEKVKSKNELEIRSETKRELKEQQRKKM